MTVYIFVPFGLLTSTTSFFNLPIKALARGLFIEILLLLISDSYSPTSWYLDCFLVSSSSITTVAPNLISFPPSFDISIISA